MRREVSWLHAELPRLVELGVLSPESAESLRRHYARPDADSTRTHWGQVLLVCFGAVLVGGGLILILAHNWDDIGRPARAAIALGLLIAAQIVTLFAVARRGNEPSWIEASSGFLVAAVGAAIAVVGQTYHVGGSFEGLMRAWLWLVLPVPYLTGSRLASFQFWGLLVVYAGSLRWREAPLDPWLLALAALPFAVYQVRRRPASWATALLTLSAAGAIFVVGSLIAVESGWRGLWSVFQVSFLGAAIAAASWPAPVHDDEAWRGRLLGLAWIVLIVIATILSFDDSWGRARPISNELRNGNVLLTALVTLACAAFSSLAAVRQVQARRFAVAAATTAPLLAVMVHGLGLAGVESVGWVAFNLWLLAAGTLTLLDGIRDLRLGTANRGLLALSALAISRFFDTDLSFLARGLGFVTLGIACFTLNIVLMRRMRTKEI